MGKNFCVRRIRETRRPHVSSYSKGIWNQEHFELAHLRALARAAVTAYMACVLAYTAGAQELPGRVSVTGSSAPVLLATQPRSSFTTASDVIFGGGSKGPYTLSRKPINRFSESVSVDGRLLQRDFDYQVDYAAGTITLLSPVSARSVIRAEYSFDPSKVVLNRSPMSVPLSLDLVKRQNTALRFTGLYKQADPAAKTMSDLVVYGLTGEKAAGGMQLTSMLLFSPDSSAQGDSSGFGDRTAARFGGSTKSEHLQISTSYLHVGEKFGGAKDFNLQQGVEAMEASAVYTPGKSLSVSSTYKRNEALAGDKKGEALATTEHKVVLTPNGAPKLTVSRTEVEKGKPGLADIKMTTDRVVLDAKPSDKLAIQSSIERKESSADGSQTGYGMNISAAPSKAVNLNASLSRVDAEKTGRSAAEFLNLTANPSKLLNLEMKVAHSNTDAAGEELSHAVKLISTPRSDWRLEIGLTGKNVDRPEDEFARTFMLSTTAMRNVAIQLDWANRESDVKGPEQVEGFRVVTTPFQAVKLSGAVSQREAPGVRDLSKEAAVEVRPFTGTTVGGAYKEVESNGEVVSRVSEVTASSKPVKYVKVSGGYKARENAGQEQLDTLNVAMELDTGKLLKVTGAYSSNPEDKKGIVQRLNSQSLGVKTDFGRLRLKGAYTLKDEYLAGRSAEQRDYGLDYRFSTYALLTTGYSVDQRTESSLLQTSVYSLGFVHRVGDTLNLYLTARMTTYERDRMLLQDQTEYEGEARVGVKF